MPHRPSSNRSRPRGHGATYAQAPTASARRRATARSGSLVRGLPSAPILMGIAALAVSAGGAITAGNPALIGAVRRRHPRQPGQRPGRRDRRCQHQPAEPRRPRSAATPAATPSPTPPTRTSSSRPRRQAEERNAALAKFAKQAEAQAAKIALNQWVLPVEPYRLTAEFGDYGLWASYHTGLDFTTAPAPDPVDRQRRRHLGSYDGSYGNKTVITLDDGTEIWYCHQNAYGVTSATSSRPARSSATSAPPATSPAPHLHVEVRPGGGDPVDPYAAFAVHGLTVLIRVSGRRAGHRCGRASVR